MEHVWENGGIYEFLTPCPNPVIASEVEECREIISLVEETEEVRLVEERRTAERRGWSEATARAISNELTSLRS